MAAFSTAAKNIMLDQLVATDGPYYVGLRTAGGVEISGPGVGGTAYARQQITFGAAASANKANSVAVVFDNGGATDWNNDAAQWALYDALTAGNVVSSGNLGATRDMSVADATLTIAIGNIDLDLTDLSPKGLPLKQVDAGIDLAYRPLLIIL